MKLSLSLLTLHVVDTAFAQKFCTDEDGIGLIGKSVSRLVGPFLMGLGQGFPAYCHLIASQAPTASLKIPDKLLPYLMLWPIIFFVRIIAFPSPIDQLIVDFMAIIDTQFSVGNVPDKYEDLKHKLGLGEFSSAPGGGFINFYSVLRKKNIEYILFSGVNEINNSHYVVTVHKVISV